MDIASEQYKKLLNISVSEFGNGHRIQNAINKARFRDVTIAFLGSSVTFGYTPTGFIVDNFPAVFCNSFSERYCTGGTCICVNEAFSGVNSMMGLAFAEMKLRESNPDIVFVEYAINNSIEKPHIIAFESLIHKLLNFESKPAVIPVIVCNKAFYTCSSYMELIAKHYDLPTVNIYNSLKYGLEEDLMTWEDYSLDYGHPSTKGHKLIADCIGKLFDKLEGYTALSYSIPDTVCFNREFSSFCFFDHSTSLPYDMGGFKLTDTMPVLPNGWCNAKNGANTPFCINLQCSSLFILYEESNYMEYGELEILENNRVLSRTDAYNIHGWNNPVVKLVINDRISTMHKFELRMRHGDEKKTFILLGFGYTP